MERSGRFARCLVSSAVRRVVVAVAVGLVVGLPALAGCGDSGGRTTTQVLQKTMADNGQAVTLTHGQRLQVRLEGNPTTGFTWEAQNMPAVLEQNGDPAYVSGGTAIGAGGAFAFTFTGKQSGDGQLTLVYHRTFEAGVPPEQTFTLHVTVQ
jgi:predicted secreted protein